LKSKYDLQHFAFYEINTKNNERKLIYISSGETICDTTVENDATLCRAYRTKSDVISSEFSKLCQACTSTEINYICIPFDINDDYSLIISITTKDSTNLNEINRYIPNIKNYLEAAKPVIESRILTDKLRDSSLRDGMTGLYNRRFLEEFIDTFTKRAKRNKETYSILMLDVDFFKSVNDTYGHDVGDKVIVAIGKVLRDNIRESDLPIRYGGEEFLLLLHNANDEGTRMVANKVHQAFADLVFDVGNGETLQKTISIGIAKFPKDGDSIWKCIKFADTALYVAKTTGRNKVVEYKKEMSENGDLR
jgi:diguanylate cyclase (GGDEF)-like protein